MDTGHSKTLTLTNSHSPLSIFNSVGHKIALSQLRCELIPSAVVS